MTVRIEQHRNRIHLRSDRPTPRLSETVPGANFSRGQDDRDPHWSIPLSLEHCLALRDRFGAELEIGPDLWAWAKAERSRRAEMGALAVADRVDLPRVRKESPTLFAAMQARPYQMVGAAWIARGRNVLIGDEPGLGKTLEAIGGVIESGVPGPYLVVAPKTAVPAVWAREIPRWWPKARVITVPDGRMKRDAILNAWIRRTDRAAFDRTWLVVHPEMVRTRVWWICALCGSEARKKAGRVELVCGHDSKGHKIRVDHDFPQLFEVEWGVTVADESDRSLVRMTGTPTQTRTGMELLRTRQGDGFRVAMSGTPFRSRPHLLWGTLNWLDGERNPAFWSWCETYWEVQVGGYTGTSRTIGKLRADREARLWDSLGPILLRRTKAEAAPDLPPKTYLGSMLRPADPDSPFGVWLDMDPKQAKAHKDMLETSVAALADGEVSAIGVLAELTRLKQFSDCYGTMLKIERPDRDRDGFEFRPALPSNKFDYLVQFLLQMGFPDDPQGKVVVASQFTAVLNLFAEELRRGRRGERDPIASAMLTGEVTGSRRTDVIDSMNLPVGQGHHLLFLNTKAGGVAITLDYADDMIILDETWVPDDQIQLEDRIHRVSRPRPVRYHYLRSAGSVEEGIALVNAERRENSARLLDGRRGIETARQVLEMIR